MFSRCIGWADFGGLKFLNFNISGKKQTILQGMEIFVIFFFGGEGEREGGRGTSKLDIFKGYNF